MAKRAKKLKDKPGDGLGDLPMYLAPYESWNFGPGLPYAFPEMRKNKTFITALAEYAPMEDSATNADASRKKKLRVWKPTLWSDRQLTFLPFVVRDPFDWRSDPPEPQQIRNLLSDALERALGRPVDIKKSRFRVAFPVPKDAMNPDVPEDGPSDPKWEKDEGLRDRIKKDKRITIVAIIDDGLPFAHRNFRDATGERTRVEFCWLQSVDADRSQKDPSVLFGREYTREQIEGYIKAYGDDEDTLYRMTGATADSEDYGSLIKRHATHGAHVMDLATGYAAERGDYPAEEIRIIAVQLPNTIALDTSGFGKDMYMLSALHYIFNRADIIAKGYKIEKPRLVINFSYGFSGGRHDGGTELEAAINQMIVRRRATTGPTALVVPAGNTFLDRLHGKVDRCDFVKRRKEFSWRIQANDRTPSYLELWFWQDFNPLGYSVELRDPSGNWRGSVDLGADRKKAKDKYGDGDPGRVRYLYDADGNVVGQISADYHRSERWRVLVAMAPSEPDKDCLPRIEAGKWTVIIKHSKRAHFLPRPIHCWIQRSADPETLRSGSRQSYLDDLKDKRFTDEGALSEIDTEGVFTQRFGSLNGMATGRTSLIVAGFRLYGGLGSSFCDARPAPYSSAGILDAGWPKIQVACSSMSDRSKVLPGTIAAGVRSGSLSFVQGTSAAAPFVAREIATAFTTAENYVVEKAEEDNYRPLLSGYCDTEPDQNETKTRLGEVRVAPHWQPGL